MTLALSGHGVESGIAVGQAHILQRDELTIREYRLSAANVESEIRRLETALESSRDHLEKLLNKINKTGGKTAEEIIRTHIAMLSDNAIMDKIREQIRTEYRNAEWALQIKLGDLLNEFRQIDDSYIAGRGEDVSQVFRLVQQFLSSEPSDPDLKRIPERLAQTLVVAEELTPGELALLGERGAAGIITEHGSPYSHTAILARSMGIPTVMGVRRGQSLIKEGEQLVLDGHYGIVFADPEESILRHYLHKQSESERFRKSLQSIRGQAPITTDGVEIKLFANAERETDLALAVAENACGVGLYRSEFLYLQGRAPNEEEQYRTYQAALKTLGARKLIIRTLDIGADKGADLVDFESLRAHANPALGLRAVRLCLRDLELFKTQLRAILKASAHGQVSCLIPMLTSVREIQAVRALMDEACDELRGEGIPFDEKMQLGGMIEVPAAALAIPELSPHLDFLSVGTNDLIQYALATDRVDESVAHLYDPTHPGIVLLLHQIFKAAAVAGIPVSVCGEMAGDRRYTRLLLALGLREFSMQPRSLLSVKQMILETHLGSARKALDTWLSNHSVNPEISLINLLDQSQFDR